MSNKFEQTNATTREFTIEFLEQITDNFSEEHIIGHGGYGTVYKGQLENGEVIALKKLYHTRGLDDMQFRNEFNHLMRTEHPNITRLVGYCYNIRHQHIEYSGQLCFTTVEERVLCFEYLQGGSLDNHISDESSGLDWHTRFNIIRGICDGLNYLHNGSQGPIYHLDLKPANILLDEKMIPKIGDFGLSRLFPLAQPYITSKTIGARGYMPPEYIDGHKITRKFDVYSLGVTVIQIMAGYEGYSKFTDMSPQKFLKHVIENWDKQLQATMSSHTSEQVKTCIEIALRCVEVELEKRPTIAEIADELNKIDTAESLHTGQVVLDKWKGDVGCTTSNIKAEMSSSLGSAMEAPMNSSLGAMGPLLRKLGSLLPLDYRLPRPLKDRIELLKADLEEISIALVEQSMVDSPNEMSKFWMNEVRELCYDIEDFVDNMMLPRSDAKMRLRLVRSCTVGRVKIARLPKRQKPCTRASKIEELRTLVWEASERHERYLDGCGSSSFYVFTGHSHVPAHNGGTTNNLVGIDDLKMKLIKRLTNKEQQLKVVAIVGPAGVGKTTLAKQVYRELGGQFECSAFVRASRKPDTRRLLGGILSQVQGCPVPPDSCTVQILTDNLTKHLQDKRYVIVIDDLWETTAWDIVASAFPEGNNFSRIITTAEIEVLALECCDYQYDNILKMKPLGREDSGKLFFNMVSGPERPCPEQLKDLSDIIITKCAGLPLAIICVAGILAIQPDNSELLQHVHGCLCSSLIANSTLEETLQEIIKLSYNSLPHYLKTCVVFLSIYPEGHTMWKVDLVNQWLAEGFICATQGIDIREVAERYFVELVNRGMIQPVEINYNDEVLSCTLHHVLLDQITFQSNEEKFITALDYSQTITGLYGKARRLSLHCSNTRYAMKPTGITLSQVRSLAFFGICECVPSVMEFKLLRVMILELWGDHQRCTSFNLRRIGSLFQLRYLKISCDASVEIELPTQIQMLRYMETLIIDATVPTVPLDIIHLPGLLHLSLGDNTHLPDDIGRIRSLCTLHYFDLGTNSEDNVLSLGNLINLEDLHLTCYTEPDEHYTEKSDEHLKRNLRALASSLGKLGKLKSVTLAPGASGLAIYADVWCSITSPPVFLQRLELLPPICIFSWLPEWIGQLRKLCVLKVVVSELLIKDMDMLTELPILTVLSLYVRQPTAESIIFKRGAFPALKYFSYTCGVLCLAFQKEALHDLQKLELCFNAHRGELYEHLLRGIEHLPNLEEIVGTIGLADGAEEPDRRAAESAIKNAIRKHPMFRSYDSTKRTNRVEEQYGPQEKQHSVQDKDPVRKYEHLVKKIVQYVKQNPDSSTYGMYINSVAQSAQALLAESSCSEISDFSTVTSDCSSVFSDSNSVDSMDSKGTAGGSSVYVVECVAFWGLTSISGRRPEMQDSVVTVPRFVSLPPFLTGNTTYSMWFRHQAHFFYQAHFFGVYDGHGGAEIADYCRDRLHAALVEVLDRIERPLSGASLGAVDLQKQWEKVFLDCFCRVDDEVGGKASRTVGQGSSTAKIAAAAVIEPVGTETMGSTAVVSVICSSHIIIANCGDSRAVLCRGKQPVPLSVEHTPNREDERARIEAADGKIVQWHGHRVFGVLSMSRAIGDGYLKPWIIPVPEVTVVPRENDDECLILASDGLWDVLSNEEVCDVALRRLLLWHKKNTIDSSSAQRSADSSDPAAQAAADALVKLALQKGSNDNITVIVVDLKQRRNFKSEFAKEAILENAEDVFGSKKIM